MTNLKKVLIVDDNEDVRALYKLALEGAEYQVKSVRSRSEAQSVLTEWSPDLIIADFRMPGLSMETFLEFIRSQTNLQKSRVIAVSSFSKGDPAIMESKLTIPFFQKPASLDELLSIVEVALEGPDLGESKIAVTSSSL
jgi:DNA-binding NtrC family response regulator